MFQFYIIYHAPLSRYGAICNLHKMSCEKRSCSAEFGASKKPTNECHPIQDHEAVSLKVS